MTRSHAVKVKLLSRDAMFSTRQMSWLLLLFPQLSTNFPHALDDFPRWGNISPHYQLWCNRRNLTQKKMGGKCCSWVLELLKTFVDRKTHDNTSSPHVAAAALEKNQVGPDPQQIFQLSWAAVHSGHLITTYLVVCNSRRMKIILGGSNCFGISNKIA